MPWFHRRQTRLDYPLLTVCLLRTAGGLRMAATGAFGFPLRSSAAEEALNDTGSPPEKRAGKALAAITHPVIEDMRG